MIFSNKAEHLVAVSGDLGCMRQHELQVHISIKFYIMLLLLLFNIYYILTTPHWERTTYSRMISSFFFSSLLLTKEPR
jgi:hypothetical protein